VLGPSGGASDDVLAVSFDGNPEASGLAALGELWLRGVEIDWARLNRDRSRKRVALPTYPFEPKRFWFDQLGGTAEVPNRPKAAAVVRRSPDEVRAWLREVWTQHLGNGDFSDEDNFFDVGGDSLMGLAMLSQVREQFRIRLRIVDVLERRTIAALTALIVERMVDGAPRATRSTSVPLHAPSPLFLVHPVGGDVACYHRLARYFDRRVIGLEGPEPDTDRAASTSVEGLATVHVETILSEVPNEPLYVAGWSSGGILALEVARQLRDRGRPAAFLGLIDSLFEEPTPVDEHEWLLWQAGRLGVAIDTESFRGLGARESMRKFLDAVRAQRGNASALELEHLMNVTVQHVEALRRHRPQPYSGPVWVLNREFARTRVQGALPPPDSDQIAALLRGPVVVEHVPGDHFTLLEEPHVAELALTLKRALASIESADSRRFVC
jgi:thioesterase domain-containing protein/acyl carrier protein